MKQIKVTTNDGETHTYGLASGEPAPAIRAGRLEFTTPGGRLMTVPLSGLVEYTVETAPKLSKADKLRAELAKAEAELPKYALAIFEAARDGAGPEDSIFSAAIVDYAQAVADITAFRSKVERFLERRAATEAKRAAEGPKAKKAAPEKTPKPRSTKKAAKA